MNRKKLERKLKRCEAKALDLFGTTKYHQIEKNHERILWLRKKLGIKNEPRRISLADILLSRMQKEIKNSD